MTETKSTTVQNEMIPFIGQETEKGHSALALRFLEHHSELLEKYKECDRCIRLYAERCKKIFNDTTIRDEILKDEAFDFYQSAIKNKREEREKIEKELDSEEAIFNDMVGKCRFYYMEEYAVAIAGDCYGFNGSGARDRVYDQYEFYSLYPQVSSAVEDKTLLYVLLPKCLMEMGKYLYNYGVI